MYRYTLSLTSAPDRVGGRQTPAAFPPPRNDPVMVLEAALAPGQGRTNAENLTSTGFLSPDRPANSDSPLWMS